MEMEVNETYRVASCSLFHLSFIVYYETSPHMFSIFTHVMKPVGDTSSEPGLPVSSILQV